MFARLVGHHPRIMFCLIVFSFANLLCFLLQYSCTIFSFSLVGFKPFFPFSFFSGFIQLPNHVLPEFHVSSDGLKEREVQLGFTAVSTGRFVLITDSFCYSFLQGVMILTDCVLKLLNVLEVTQNGGNGNFELKGLCHEIFQNLNVENCHQIQ